MSHRINQHYVGLLKNHDMAVAAAVATLAATA